MDYRVDQILTLHTPLVVSSALTGLRGLGEMLALTLSIDKSPQYVGDTPTYQISGGVPGREIYWSSFQNGASTGEVHSGYGQVIESNGTASLKAGGPWGEEHIGTWRKEIALIDPTTQQWVAAGVDFVVLPAPGADSGGASNGGVSPGGGTTPTTGGTSGGGILEQLQGGGFQIGGYFVPYTFAIVAGLAGYFLFLKRR